MADAVKNMNVWEEEITYAAFLMAEAMSAASIKTDWNIQSDVSSHYITENLGCSCQIHDALLFKRRQQLLLGVF